MNHSPEENINKIYPIATPEVAKMLGLVSGPAAGDSGHAAELHHAEAKHTILADYTAHPSAHNSGDLSEPARESAAVSSAGNIAKALKAVTPYIVVFTAALFVYFYFFSGSSFNFGSVFNSVPKVETAKETALAQLQRENMGGYQKWIAGFYYDISDAKVIDPDADNSGNGLSNFQKYLLNLNPKAYDTLGLGMSDSDALFAGINPLTGNRLTDPQNSIVENYFDKEVISNRQTLAALKKSGAVAGASVTNNYGFGAPTAQAANNQPVPVPPQNQNPQTSPFSGAGFDVDMSKTGILKVPSLNIEAPIVWSSDPKNFDKDLQNGVIHYPGTALPGQIGTSYISGHSSNYSWAKGSYNTVFTKLDKLADNTSFSVTVTDKDGKAHILHYVVVGRQQYNPNDEAQFKNGAKSVVALSTCWPVGSTKYRLVVFGELTQVEN